MRSTGGVNKSKMGRVTVHITPLALYLLALSLYGFVMMMSSLNKQHHDDHYKHRNIHHHQEEEEVKEAVTKGEHGARRSARIKRGGARWLRDAEDFYKQVRTMETTCHKLISFGGTSCQRTLDNNKYVCQDPDVALDPNNCTVYSFGIGNDATFDDQMSNFGCEVHMFDPSINANAVISTNRDHQHFHHLGLATEKFTRTFNVVDEEPGEDGTRKNETIVGNFRPYSEIRETLHHNHKPVHYLKLDIEGGEWEVLPDLGNKGHLRHVRQLAIEVHTSPIIKAPQHKVLDMLHFYWERLEEVRRQGFLRAVYQPTLVAESSYKLLNTDGTNFTFMPTCFELLYLRRGPVY